MSFRMKRLNISVLAKVGMIRKYQTNEIIFQEAKPGNEMYIILEGMVEIRSASVSLATLESGNIFGEMAIFDSFPRSASALALKPTSLLVIPKDKSEQALTEDPALAFNILVNFSERIRVMNVKLKELDKIAHQRSLDEKMKPQNKKDSTLDIPDIALALKQCPTHDWTHPQFLKAERSLAVYYKNKNGDFPPVLKEGITTLKHLGENNSLTTHEYLKLLNLLLIPEDV